MNWIAISLEPGYVLQGIRVTRDTCYKGYVLQGITIKGMQWRI